MNRPHIPFLTLPNLDVKSISPCTSQHNGFKYATLWELWRKSWFCQPKQSLDGTFVACAVNEISSQMASPRVYVRKNQSAGDCPER